MSRSRVRASPSADFIIVYVKGNFTASSPFIGFIKIMIKSAIVKIKKINNFDNLYIETELKRIYSDIIRWAVVDIDNVEILISVSYVV